MKLFLLLLMVITPVAVFCQDMQFVVSANGKSITVSPENKEENKLFIIDTQLSKNDLLTIKVKNEEIENDWKRNFLIYDSADNAMKDFVLMNNKTYCIKLSDIKNLLQKQQEYFIYTTAIPKDRNKAMLVKVARILVCKIKIL